MRDFSVIRRRRNLVDILTPKRAGIEGYRFQAATNFDGSYTTLFTAPISSGYLDPNVNSAKLHSVNNNDHIRAVFDPVTFSLVDSSRFWLRFVTVAFGGAVGTPGPGTLILTDDEHYGNGRVQIAGTAPSGAAVANSLQLNLPQSSREVVIKNANASGGNALYVAFQVGGAEQQVSPQETLRVEHGPIDLLMVRGAGGTAAFSASFTNYLPL